MRCRTQKKKLPTNASGEEDCPSRSISVIARSAERPPTTVCAHRVHMRPTRQHRPRTIRATPDEIQRAGSCPAGPAAREVRLALHAERVLRRPAAAWRALAVAGVQRVHDRHAVADHLADRREAERVQRVEAGVVAQVDEELRRARVRAAAREGDAAAQVARAHRVVGMRRAAPRLRSPRVGRMPHCETKSGRRGRSAPP